MSKSLRDLQGDSDVYNSWMTDVSLDGRRYTRATPLGPGCDQVCEGESQWVLGRRFNTFTAVVGVDDESATGSVARVQIFADGRPYGAIAVEPGVTRSVTLDVRGVLRLSATEAMSGRGSVWLGDPVVTTAYGRGAAPTGAAGVWALGPATGQGGFAMSVGGIPYPNSWQLAPRQASGANFELQLNRRYRGLQAALEPHDDAFRDIPADIEISGDGRVLWTGTVSQRTLIALDVTNVFRLRFLLTNGSDQDWRIVIEEPRLTS